LLRTCPHLPNCLTGFVRAYPPRVFSPLPSHVFTPIAQTNRLRRDFTNPNLRLFSTGGFGCYAYNHFYERGVALLKGQELGRFNLGSTVVMIFEAPVDFQFTAKVKSHAEDMHFVSCFVRASRVSLDNLRVCVLIIFSTRFFCMSYAAGRRSASRSADRSVPQRAGGQS
jgi:hypothetical protein